MPMNPRLLRPLATGFNPKSIAGLQAWYDFADIATLGPTSSGVGTVTNNGPVKFVKDKSGSNLNLNQPGADSVAPTFLLSGQNALPSASFDGGDVLQATSGVHMTPAFTLFIVCKANITGTTRFCGVASQRSIGPFAATNTQWGFFSSGGAVASFGVSATAASVLAMTCDSASASVFYGNGTQGSTGTAASVTVLDFGLGASRGTTGTGDNGNGIVCEVLSYNSVLTAKQLSAVSRYLGRKWGITVA
jgi:hypothetical protein